MSSIRCYFGTAGSLGVEKSFLCNLATGAATLCKDDDSACLGKAFVWHPAVVVPAARWALLRQAELSSTGGLRRIFADDGRPGRRDRASPEATLYGCPVRLTDHVHTLTPEPFFFLSFFFCLVVQKHILCTGHPFGATTPWTDRCKAKGLVSGVRVPSASPHHTVDRQPMSNSLSRRSARAVRWDYDLLSLTNRSRAYRRLADTRLGPLAAGWPVESDTF